jgi:GNAT superfamily N-acetyltransferase
LRREEIPALWSIDRSERIENVYILTDGELRLRPDHFNVRGWPTGEVEKYTPLLVDCHDRGGWFYGLFDDGLLVGVAVLEQRFIGKSEDQLPLKFLQVSRAFRGRGLGKRLFEMAKGVARKKGAGGLYISATASEHTVNFYMQLGCKLGHEPDLELWELEPEDIHLECIL